MSKLWSSAALLALVVATPALAADAGYTEPTDSLVGVGAPDWIVTLKATGVVTPTFEGSDKYGLSGYPGVSFRRPDQPWKFGAPDDGFGLALFDTTYFRVGPVARIRSERDIGDQNKLRGLDHIDWAFEPGVFAEYYPIQNIRLRGELRHGVTGHHGFVGDVAADWIQRMDRFTVSFGPRMSLGDSKFMGTYFGVSAEEARDNRRVDRRYNPDGGVKSVGLSGAVTYDWTENWSTTAFGSYNLLVGDAAKSPIVKKVGSKNQFTAGVGVAYSFGVDW